MIEKALLENLWTSLGQYGQDKKSACDYWGCEYKVDFEGRILRAVVLSKT
jgi:hypothetical protein